MWVLSEQVELIPNYNRIDSVFQAIQFWKMDQEVLFFIETKDHSTCVSKGGDSFGFLNTYVFRSYLLGCDVSGHRQAPPLGFQRKG